MKATDIITRALNLADLQNSQYITWNDKSQSLFESYRDLYSEMIDAEDDYFLIDIQIGLTNAMVSANSASMLQEYLVPMPEDCDRLRYVLYNGQSIWQVMPKFQIASMNIIGSPPRYRWQNGNLWIIGTANFSFNTIRVGYYPKQPIATVPDDDYEYGSGFTQISYQGLVTYPCYLPFNTWELYVYNGTAIQTDSPDGSAFGTVLYTGASTITYLNYTAGYVYFLMSGNIYRGAFTGTSVVPTALTAIGTITSFSISLYDNLLYYTNGTNIYSMALSGGSATLVTAANGSSVYNFGGSFTFYVDTSGNLKTVSGTTLATNVSSASTDGTTFVFTLDTSGNLTSYQVDLTGSVPALKDASVLRSDITFAGPYAQTAQVYPGDYSNVVTGRIPVIDRQLDILAISSIVDYDFAYPVNEANEIMAYQCAIDFARKAARLDTMNALMQRLGVRAKDAPDGRSSGLWARLETSMIVRDDFKPERISNVYSRGWW